MASLHTYEREHTKDCDKYQHQHNADRNRCRRCDWWNGLLLRMPDQLLANGLLVGLAPAIERNFRYVSNSKRAKKAPTPPKSGCGFILLHTRTSTHDLSRFRNDRHCSSMIRKERKHENVTRNRTCCSCADG